jgi:hypothetical protein
MSKVLAFSSLAEAASGSAVPESPLEASNSVRHAAARTAGGTAELPAIIFKTRMGSRSGFEVDDEFVLARRLHRKVGRLLAPEDAIDVASRTSLLVDEIGTI